MITIDLNHFKLHLHLKSEDKLSLHFDTPSRRFYLSVIGLVVHEMKKRGRIAPISMEKHLDVLTLLNETVGAAAGSSKKDHLLPRIYRKWKDALPDLENAPLFKVVGRKKRYDETMDRVYGFDKGDRDCWANLFDYSGSHENVRLRFSIDHLGVVVDEVNFVYGDLNGSDSTIWEAFVTHLKEKSSDQSITGKEYFEPSMPKSQSTRRRNRSISMPDQWRWPVISTLIGLIVVTAIVWILKINLFGPEFQVASPEKMAFPLPEKPSIAVLPFRNLSGNPGQDYFSDGLTEEIITALSKVPSLFVIARDSTFAFRGKQAQVHQVSEALGVRYILEGSVRIIGDRVRITTQLTDVIKGRNLWAERYDRELNDILSIQDDLTLNILAALTYKLTGEDRARLYRKTTENLRAYLKVLEGVGYVYAVKIDAAIRCFEEAITLDPNYAGAYAAAASAQFYNFVSGPRSTRWQSLVKAKQCAKKCSELDDELASCDMVMGHVHLADREFIDALAKGKRATALCPNSALAATYLAATLRILKRHDEAIRELEKALRLNPIRPVFALTVLGATYFDMGRPKDAIQACRRAVKLVPNNTMAYMILVLAYSAEQRWKDARSAAKHILRLRPDFVTGDYQILFPDKTENDINNITNGVFGDEHES